MLDFLLKHAAEKPTSFHMPGHKGSELYKCYGYQKFINNIMECDITEIPGADNLFQAEGIIKKLQEKYAELYGVKKSYLLVNGTSVGLLSAITTLVEPGGKLIMARNSHKSVFNALTLGGITPVYAYPEVIQGTGITGEIKASQIERLILSNLDAKAVILPSPNYYGICSDIQEIAASVHKLGKLLIVDQAHGAHLKFLHDYFPDGSMPKSAEESGADIVVNSIHKTMASFTQSAVLNVCSDRVNLSLLEDKLQMLQSTSPSYLLMGSLAVNAALIENSGDELMTNWADNINLFYRQSEVLERIKVLDNVTGMPILDRTKINVDTTGLGISGYELEAILNRRYSIFPELVTGNIVMFMTGIGNLKKDYENLILAFHKIEKELMTEPIEPLPERKKLPPLPMGQRVLFAVPKQKKKVKLDDAEGKICAASIIPYPPGIPIVCPGEMLTKDMIAYVKALRNNGEKVMGITDESEVFVG